MTTPAAARPHARALEAVERILDHEAEADDALRGVVDAIHEHVDHYTWLGLYFVEERELSLGPWCGAGGLPEHTRLPLGEGVIGRAVAARRTEVLPDVGAVDGFAARFAWTRSEIGIPVVYDGSAVAVLGIDSDQLNAFRPDDRAFLERVTTLISAHCLVGWDTGGVPWPEVDAR